MEENTKQPQVQKSPESHENIRARAIDFIQFDEQQYVDANLLPIHMDHNDIYPTTYFDVIKIGDDGRVLLKDNTGQFWVPRNKLEIL